MSKDIFDFNQKKFMDSVFSFMKQNDLTVRDFCALSGCSAHTLYRARDKADESPMKIETIRRLNTVMKKYAPKKV